MAVNLNLLPQDLSVGGALAKAIKVIRAIDVIALAVFILFAIGASAFFIISSIQLTNVTSANSSLASQIKGLQTTEQQLVLLKDRIGKIKLANASDTSKPAVDLSTPLLTALPASASVNELTLETNKITASILFKSSADISNFFQQIYSSTSFSLVELTSFGFNPKTGYLVSIALTGK